jgi:hypothetical protein
METSMLRATRTLATLALLLIAAGCTPSMDPAAAGRARTRSYLITFEEMEERGQFSSLYDLIAEMRPRWLRSQGPDTFMGPGGQVQVHMDGNRLGGVDALRRLSAYGVTSIQWLAPIDAAARFGLDHSHGVIIISTAPIHDPS